jgi:predicted nucleic-acid-binding protein
VRAVDTNVLVRYLMRDDPRQAAVAEDILRQPSYIPRTVLLETVWTLESRYGQERATIAAILDDLMRLPDVTVDDAPMMRWAIGRYAKGADFADMVHLVGSRAASTFATFDRAVARKAGGTTPIPVETLK